MKAAFGTMCLALAVLSGTAVAAGDNISLGDTIRFFDREGTTGGGEFGVAIHPAVNTEVFRTFCVERGEFLDFNQAGFTVVGISTTTVMSGFSLNTQAAYLYTQFRNGGWANATAFAGDGVYGGANHVDDANVLQQAIWSFMGQTFTNSPQVQALIDEANAFATNNAAWGIGNVRVLNLVWATDRNYLAGTHAQDVLTLIPLPTGAGLAMAGLGLLAIRRRTTR